MARLIDLIVTTEKDILKLIRYPFARDKLMALRVGMHVADGEQLRWRLYWRGFVQRLGAIHDCGEAPARGIS